MCNCFNNTCEIILETERYQVFLTEIASVDFEAKVETKLGLGILINDEKGDLKAIRFDYCPKCGKKVNDDNVS